ncbi:MAG: alpha/beta hydrolase family protein [Planctomycetota bacterium]|jgi:dienelactone hydrolase
MHVPGLWVYGAEDRIIPARESAAILDELVHTQGKPFTVITHPGQGHGLRGERPYWPEVLAWFDEHVQ